MKYTIHFNEETKSYEVHDAEGTLIGSFDRQDEAFALITESMASVPDASEIVTETPEWFEIEFLEGEESVDKRVIDIGATNFDRPTPLPLMWTNEQSMMHQGSVVVGKILELERVGADKIVGRGQYDTSDAAVECHRLVGEEMMSYWSPDMSVIDSMVEITDQDEDGFPTDFLDHLVSGTFLGGTVVTIQALTSAKIKNIPAPSADATPATPPADTAPVEAPIPAEEVTASAQVITLHDAPPRAFFEDPKLKELTPIEVTTDGRIFGHLAPDDECHIGRDDVCITAPHSATGYAYFQTGCVITDEGEKIPTGVITLGTGHASTTRGMSAQAAIEHYDNTGTGIADVAAGEDEFGIWVSGALRPGVTPEQIRVLRASALSGDWRWIGGSLEMVAALVVNHGGFPIPQTKVLVASGECIALVAAGVPQMLKKQLDRHSPDSQLANRVALLESIIKPMLPQAIESLDARIHASA